MHYVQNNSVFVYLMKYDHYRLYDDSKCKWSPTSMALLEDAEKRILACKEPH